MRSTVPLVALLTLLVAAPVAADEPVPDEPTPEEAPPTGRDAEPAKPKRFRWFAMPTVGYDADDGFGLGARFEIQKMAPEVEPYVAWFMVQGWVTLKGHHNHKVELDLPGLGPRAGMRLTIRVAYRQWLNDGYWGLGNGVTRERAFVGRFDKDDPRRKRYRYWLAQPFAFVGLRWRIDDSPMALFGTVLLQWTRVQTWETSILAEHRPPGMDGGFTVQLSGGFLVDTRAPEVAPNEGVLVELSGRLAPAFPGSTGAWGGPFASVRAWFGLVPDRLVLATRLMAEHLVGDVPFFEMVRWGGSMPILGVGGYETVRGMPFGRWRGPGRAVGNVELRIDLFRHRLFKEPLRWQLVPFVDVAAVWGAGDDATAPPPEFPLHPTVGLGAHWVFAQSFVARIDAGFGPDAVREEDGSITQEPGWGLYLQFGQTW
jgi:hypothetical protein